MLADTTVQVIRQSTWSYSWLVPIILYVVGVVCGYYALKASFNSFVKQQEKKNDCFEERFKLFDNRFQENNKCLLSLKQTTIELKTKIDLIWGVVENKMPLLLQSPTNFRKDELLQKFAEDSNKMTLLEMNELFDIINGEFNKKKDHLYLVRIFVLERLKQLIDGRK